MFFLLCPAWTRSCCHRTSIRKFRLPYFHYKVGRFWGPFNFRGVCSIYWPSICLSVWHPAAMWWTVYFIHVNRGIKIMMSFRPKLRHVMDTWESLFYIIFTYNFQYSFERVGSVAALNVCIIQFHVSKAPLCVSDRTSARHGRTVADNRFSLLVVRGSLACVKFKRNAIYGCSPAYI